MNQQALRNKDKAEVGMQKVLNMFECWLAGEENTAGEESGSAGGQRARLQLRQDRRGGDATSGFAVHSISACPPPQNVGSGQDAGRRWPSREMGSLPQPQQQ